MKVQIAGKITIHASGPVAINDFTFEATEEEKKLDPTIQQSLACEAATKWALARLLAEVERAQAEALRKMMKGRQAS